MNFITPTLSQIGLFFKDAINSISRVFDLKFLTTPLSGSSKYGLVYIVILAIIIVSGLIFQIIVGRRTYPKFYKKFLFKISSFLIYLPTVLIFFVFIRIGGINALTSPIYSVTIIAIWLIWFFYLVYYRIVVVKRYWVKYYNYKREEKYFKYGKAKK